MKSGRADASTQPEHSVLGLLEDYERKRVPTREGRGWFALTLVFLGICIAIPSFLLGSALVVGVGMRDAVGATFWGCLIATPISLLAAHVGVRSRLSTAMTLRFSFGNLGARFISAIIAVDMFCWFAVNTEIFGTSLRHTLLSVWSLGLNRPLLCVAAGILMTAVTIFGYRSVEKMAFVVVPLLAVVLSSYAIYMLTKHPLAEVLERGALGHPISYPTAISIVAGTSLSICVLLPDFTRYSKSAAHTAWAVILGLSLGLPPFILIGAYLTAATDEPDFIKTMLVSGWGLIAIVVVALTCWIHMNTDLYSASLNLSSIVPRMAKWKLTAFAGLAGTALALFGIVSRYVPFLIILSVVLPPIAGVYTGDYLVRRKVYETAGLENLSRLRPLTLAAWLLGVAVGFATAPKGEMGLGLFNLTTLPAIDSFLASFVAQLALVRLFSARVGAESETLGESV
jgi:cytosine permease